jgi:hypothetical protein
VSGNLRDGRENRESMGARDGRKPRIFAEVRTMLDSERAWFSENTMNVKHRTMTIIQYSMFNVQHVNGSRLPEAL